MKRIIITLFYLCLSIELRAQFAPEGATWHYGEAFAFSGDISVMKFVAEGDTIIQGVTCQKIKKYGQVDCLGRPSMEFTYEADSIVYYFNPHDSEFEILYDFTAGPGDSWIVYTHEYNGDENVLTVFVDSIDIVVINGMEWKRMYVQYQYDFFDDYEFSYPVVIVEKLGDVYYMFDFLTMSSLVCDGNYSTGLRCYEDETFGLYETGIADSCTYSYTWVGLSEIDQNDLISIYPNPATDLLMIKADPRFAPAKYIIQDFGGRLIQKGVMMNNEVYIGGIPSGVYLLKFYSDDNELLSVKKLIKI